MEQVNKPPTWVTNAMWFQIVILALNALLIAAISLLVLMQGKDSKGDLLAIVLFVVAYAGLGVFAARSILRGRWWGWWIELPFAVPLALNAFGKVAEFRGFTPVSEPEVFMRETMSEIVTMIVAPFFLAAPLACIWMAILWRRREVAFKSSAANEQQ